ncbi:hypothetical protein Tco_1492064 [Tanacetum coccineum]
MTSREMRETNAYNTYTGYATGVTPPKKARKFKKPAFPKLSIVPALTKEPAKKSKRVKRPAKKSSDAPIGGVVIRETPVKSLSKKKEKMTVEKRKRINLLSEVALTKEAQYEEDEDDSNNEHDSRSEGSDEERDSVDDHTQSNNEKRLDSKHETDDNESGSESDQEENEEDVEDDEEEKDDELVKTPSNDTDDEDETKIKDKAEVDTDKGFIQKEGTNAEMINVQQGNENLKISQFIEDAHVTLSTVPQKTAVPVTISSHSFDLASKFLKFLDIPHTDAEIVSPMDVPVHYEILPKEVSNFAPPVIQSMVTESLEHAVLAKESSQPKTLYEAASLLIEFELKKILIDKMDEMYSLKRSRKDKDKDEYPPAGSDRGLKKRKTNKSVQSEEPKFEVAYSDMPQDQDENLECYKALSEKLDWNNPEGGDYPFDLTKTLPLVMNGNRQMVQVDYFFNNDLKYLQGGISTMTYTTSITKTKGISHWRQQLTRVEVLRRADNDLYTFKEGDFPRLRINDIKDMLLLIVQNRLTNSSGDDVFNFAIALPMFTRSMVIQKRVEDLQLGVESYQKKINVTKPETIRLELRDKDPYTPYQDPQGFIYVDNKGRTRSMRSDELYKFSDRTLTGLQTLLDDITKNI